MDQITMRFEAKSLADFTRAFKKYEGDVARRVLRDINVTAAQVNADAKKRFIGNVPGDDRDVHGLRPHVRTGSLRAGIHTDYATPTDMEAAVISGVNYGPHVEFGTSKSRAHPYMNPAAEMNRRDHSQRLSKALKP